MFLPVGDDNSRYRIRPWVTYALIATNIVLFIVTLNQGSEAAIQSFFNKWSVVPVEYRDSVDYPPVIAWPYWVTVFSAMFLHGSFAHIIGNMLFLWVFGDNIENALDRLNYLLFYLVCGVAGSVAHIVFNWDSPIPSLGASGAIAGVLGAYLMLYPRNRIRVLFWFLIFSVPAWLMLGGWIFLQFINGYTSLARTEQTSGVAYMAHIGGFVAGAVLILVLRLLGALRRMPHETPRSSYLSKPARSTR